MTESTPQPAVFDSSGSDVLRPRDKNDRHRKVTRGETSDPPAHRATYQAVPLSRRELRAQTGGASPVEAPIVGVGGFPPSDSEAEETPVTPPPVTAKRSKQNWRFPALDGLRGIAVISVMLYHTNWSPHGLFGVDVFFVISGFLITLLLLRELSTTGRIRIGSFFVRRVKRLIPALLITLALVLGTAWWLSDIREFTEIANRAWWTLWQAANWSQIADGTAYWDASSQIKPLAQMWSLSITEQFYLAWPFLIAIVWFICRRRAMAVGIALLVLTAGAALVAPLLWDGENSDRLYLGTDARAVAFVAGAAAAGIVVWIKTRPRRRTEPRRGSRLVVTSLSVIALAVVVAASVVVNSYHDAWLYQGGLAVVAVAAAVLVGTLCFQRNALVRFFSFSPFRGIGIVSYSVFLLHLPVYWVLQKLTPTIAPMTLLIVGGTITWLLAAFLHHGITERIRKVRWKVWPALPILVLGIAIVAAGAHYLPILRAQQAALVTVSEADPDMPKGIEGGRPLVLTLGDSLANDFASTLADHGTGAVAVVDQGQGGCGLLDATSVRATSGYVWDTTDCPDWRETWKTAMAAQPTDVILIHVGWDAGEQLIDGTWIGPKDATFQTIYATALDDMITMAEAEAPQARIVFVLDRPTDGIISDPTVTAAFNQLLTDAATRHPSVAVADLGAALCGVGTCRTADDAGRDLFLPDDVHFSPSGQDFIAPWLEQFLRDVLLDN